MCETPAASHWTRLRNLREAEERRLRSARHEQLSVGMALTAAAHHSAQQNAALRGQKSGTGASDLLQGCGREFSRIPRCSWEGSVRRARAHCCLHWNCRDESLDAAALAFLMGVSLEHQKEKEQEAEETEELQHRRHSGKLSPIGLCIAKLLSRWGGNEVRVVQIINDTASLSWHVRTMHLIGWQNTWEQAPGVPATPSPP